MRTQSRFRIALVNNADPSNPEHWAPKVSVREQRAIRQARKLKAEGNTNVMLFKKDEKGNWFPVSLKRAQPAPSSHQNFAPLKQYDAADAKARTSVGLSKPKPKGGLKFSDRAIAQMGNA